ncbi:dimethylamine monooxygenase subunit DmmA family protein [Brevibacterium litoralis]|uniref:dimethylamine monooxygenase subunit DmmA family protein n=1 Tax=Brevibacterium litoralis TaxID=3138935 RepID=UPI0032ED9EE2
MTASETTTVPVSPMTPVPQAAHSTPTDPADVIPFGCSVPRAEIAVSAGTPAAEAPAGLPLDRAVHVHAVGFGASGRRVTRALVDGAPCPVTLRSYEEADPTALAEIAGAMKQSPVGVRLVLAGPQVDVHAARSRALGVGLVPEEILTSVTCAADIQLYCPHCKEVNRSRARVGDTTSCLGCRRDLLVYHHFSRRHAAYLGFMVDAEDPAAQPRAERRLVAA